MEVIQIRDSLNAKREGNYLNGMESKPAEIVLAAYRQSVSREDGQLEQQLLGIIEARTDFRKDDWAALLHGSPNGSELARLALGKLKQLN